MKEHDFHRLPVIRKTKNGGVDTEEIIKKIRHRPQRA